MNSSSFNGYNLSATLILECLMIVHRVFVIFDFSALIGTFDVSRASSPYCVYHNSKMLILERKDGNGTTILEYFIEVDVNQASILNFNQLQHLNIYDELRIRLPLTTITELLKLSWAIWCFYLIARFI